ncbi:MAG: hypothetical protein J5601_01680 [Elusimicrobiaceae bacterium]|nr:hypothetical protein [Elusimicrobiaceae bacterium]
MRKILYFLTATLATTSLQAADINSPCYLPEAGKLLSTTRLEYTDFRAKQDSFEARSRQKSAFQDLNYGLSDKVAFAASVGNSWVRGKQAVLGAGVVGRQNETTNIDWSAGANYRFFRDDNWANLLSLKYLQKETHRRKGAYKAFNADARIGYDFKDVLLAYIGGIVELPFAQSKYADNNMKYALYTGVYKNFCQKVTADVRFGLNYDKNFSQKEWTGKTRLSYSLAENTSVGLFTEQTLYGKARKKYRVYEHRYGADLKIGF